MRNLGHCTIDRKLFADPTHRHRSRMDNSAVGENQERRKR
ncbi:hypothetical protein SynPROS71_01665 [Synechococcus sp. PROS-7-1]|nr:hypothetical protein SynPROS71_01665 [Synechococcus sp. PROS-7-1]